MNLLEEAQGERPSPDYVWCGECCRWEYEGDGRNHKREYLRPHGIARVLYRLADFFFAIATRIATQAQLAFIRDNRRRGIFVESPTEEDEHVRN